MDVKNSDMIDLSLDEIIKMNRKTKKAEANKAKQNVFKTKNNVAHQQNSNAGTFQTRQNVYRNNKKFQNVKRIQKFNNSNHQFKPYRQKFTNKNQNYVLRKVQQSSHMINRRQFQRNLNVQGQFQQQHQNRQGGFQFQQRRQFPQGRFYVQQRQGGFQIQRQPNFQGRFQTRQQQNSQGGFQQRRQQNSQGGFHVQQQRFKNFKNQKVVDVALKTFRPRINRNFQRFDNQVPQIANNFQRNRLMNDVLTVSIPNNLAKSNGMVLGGCSFQNAPQEVEDDLEAVYVSPRFFQTKQFQLPAPPQNLTMTTLNERFAKNFATTIIY